MFSACLNSCVNLAAEFIWNPQVLPQQGQHRRRPAGFMDIKNRNILWALWTLCTIFRILVRIPPRISARTCALRLLRGSAITSPRTGTIRTYYQTPLCARVPTSCNMRMISASRSEPSLISYYSKPAVDLRSACNGVTVAAGMRRSWMA